jgi:hypothetical protein
LGASPAEGDWTRNKRKAGEQQEKAVDVGAEVKVAVESGRVREYYCTRIAGLRDCVRFEQWPLPIMTMAGERWNAEWMKSKERQNSEVDKLKGAERL